MLAGRSSRLLLEWALRLVFLALFLIAMLVDVQPAPASQQVSLTSFAHGR